MYLSRKHTDETLADIGRVFNRDHSTVMHSIKVISGLNRRDNSVSAQIDLLSDKVSKL
jgi:chromosomal replication initiator protein